MLENKIIKNVIIMIIFILVFNVFTPSIYAFSSNIEDNETLNLLDLDNEVEDEEFDMTNDFNDNSNDTDYIDDVDGNLLDESDNLSNDTVINNAEYINDINIELDDEQNNNDECNDQENDSSVEELQFSANVNVDGYIINTYLYNNIYYLFLPQGVSLSNTIINYTGNVTKISAGIVDAENKTITNDFSQNNTIIVSANDIDYTITVLQTDLPSISISLNGVTLEEINSGSKETKYKGNSLTLKTANNEKYNLTDDNVEVKGRGNFTWTLPKRAYQFKLSSKENVLGLGKSKTWILLANYADSSMIRNKITSDFASEIGLEYTGDSTFIDLWIDGDYQGNYLLIEKVEIGTNRVELSEDDGFIAELDNNYYMYEQTYFTSKTSKTAFVLKDSVADDEGEVDSVSEKTFKEFENYINEFESYLYSENKDWTKISSMIDVESFIKYYFIQEFTEDPDGARSSVYMYKDGINDILHMGPIWDYDSALGNYTSTALGGNPKVDYIINIQEYMSNSNDWYAQLFQIKEFKTLAIEMYNKVIKQSLENVTTNINNYKIELSQSAKMNFIRWNTLGQNTPFVGSDRVTKNTYNEEVDYLSNWVKERIDYLNERYSENSNILTIKYTSHIQDYGWNQDYSVAGEISGTEGECKRLEAIKINLDTFNTNAKINYQVHVEDYGWMDWKQNGEIAGTTGEEKRIEAIRIKLDNIENYSIQYRVHIQDIGWTNWVNDGELAGTTGKSLRMEAIQIRLVEIPKNTITYTTHVQDIGWQSNVINGNIAGTTGKSLRLEGIKINLLNNTENIHIKYSAHIQDIGWQDWKYDGEFSGTEGECKRLEAIKIELEGTEDYDVKYRVHVQDIGWQDWKQNGEVAGTEGKCLRLEAIQIKLEKK